MESGNDLPIVGVCIVSDPAKLPPNYTLIDKTQDNSEDADLWKDGFFAKRVMRYLCVQRQIPTNNQDVLVDVALINEKDGPPPGFTVLEITHDSGEKATKRKSLCLRWMISSMTPCSITDLIFISRAQRRAPMNYTMVGELNNMSMCYKMGPKPTTTPSPNETSQSFSYPMSPPSGGLSYGSTPSQLSSSSSGLGINTAVANESRHPGSLSPPVQVTALSGIQWKINPRYGLLMELQNLTIPEIHGKTLMEIERQYEYTFDLEKSVSKTPMVS